MSAKECCQVIHPSLATEEASQVSDLYRRVVSDAASGLFHLRTVWLFTRNDLESIVYPVTAFGISSALSGPVLTTGQPPLVMDVIGRIPRIIIWIWLNLLVFNIANQRLPSAVSEDKVNKPTRPLPSGRLTVEQARRLLLAVTPVAVVVSSYVGAATESMAVMVMGWMYNDLGGAEEGFVIKNLLNACGVISYNLGALRVACGPGRQSPSPVAYAWLSLLGAVIFTTVHLQDLYDQAGDSVRGRKTFPLVLGDCTARWTVAVLVMVWSFFCPYFWRLGGYCFIGPVAFGGLVAFRVMMLRTVSADKLTWKLWSLWMASLFLLPLLKNYTTFRLQVKDGIALE